jgi:glycosyltransferase involved in cell wall biosynthesis
MPMTVLNVAYPMAPVGPDAAGGAEQILWQLDRALVEAGHVSLVVACEGSNPAGELIPISAPSGAMDTVARVIAQHETRIAVRETLSHRAVDVVHLHGLDFDAYLPPPGPPAIATLHLPPAWYSPEVFKLRRPNTWLHCVSESQRRQCPPCPYLLPEIPNGVDVREAAPVKRRDFALIIGRICPEKGFHLAMEAARLSGVPLVIAGRVFPYEAHVRYFQREIEPKLDSRLRFFGVAGKVQKEKLYSEARCVLVPSLADETSSLVALEALASGTPVIAFPKGALPEIIEHGKTGFLVNTVEEMANAIHRTGEIDSDECRKTARDRFPVQRMIERYFEMYMECLEWMPFGAKRKLKRSAPNG